MSQDLMSKFYTCLNWRLDEKLTELARIIDESSPNKELQTLFPQLVNNIFGTSFNNNWNLKTTTFDHNRYEFEALISFLEPQGPMFRLCYKLLTDPQLKYDLPLNQLPLDLQISLERGRSPQFYTDLLVMDSQSLNYYALALNPFDYYMFNFALHLLNSGQHQSSWENWNSVYFALSCDYLMHFLPSDPNVSVLPHIPNYVGKVPMTAPLQTANRPMSPSLLLLPNLTGISNQPTSPQTQSRNEVWRSETVLEVFVDIWMSVEQFNPRDVEAYQRNYPVLCSSPERVRTVRVLVKHLHAFSAKQLADTASRSSALRKYARQMMSVRAYHYVKYLVMTWPLDASFRLVLELWLSLIQPWRYTDNTINQDRFPGRNMNQEEGTGTLDSSSIQFIAENFPTYTCILQLVLPRFMRLDLTAYKNAVMLFRLGKVFSQPHLVPILRNLEQAIIDSTGFHRSHDSSFSTAHEQSYTYNGLAIHKWVAVAKQAISELNMSANFEYDPIWSENKIAFATDFVKRIRLSKQAAEDIVQQLHQRIQDQNKGLWSKVKSWFMIGNQYEDEVLLEESKKVPIYLNNCIQYIFVLYETLLPTETIVEETNLENSSFANSTNFQLSITNKLRSTHTDIQYMGDPDLMPITSYENTILVRMFYQIASKLNEMYGQQFEDLWSRGDYLGFVSREVLQRPCVVRRYVRAARAPQRLAADQLRARLSLRRLGSHAVVVWLTFGYVLFRLFSYSGLTYIFILVVAWALTVISTATLKFFKLVRT